MAISTIAVAAFAGASVYQGEQTKRASKRAERRQADAQRLAEAQVVSESRRAEEAFNKANRKRPDVVKILAAERELSQGGLGSTTLTGSSGIDYSKVRLNKPSLLGG